MSFPTIPNITPSINLNRTEVINLLLASVAFEELGLAHIINAEGEKIQAALGTLPGLSIRATTISDLLSVNREVRRTLQTALKSQMLLQFKLEDIMDIPPLPVTPLITIHNNTATVIASFNGEIVTDSDLAYYHTVQ
jgi:hypothetical protein